MSTIYRKSGGREFYKIDEETKIVTRVLNKQMFSRVDVSVNRLIYEDAFDDCTQQATESEFNTAYKEAMERITSGKI